MGSAYAGSNEPFFQEKRFVKKGAAHRKRGLLPRRKRSRKPCLPHSYFFLTKNVKEVRKTMNGEVDLYVIDGELLRQLKQYVGERVVVGVNNAAGLHYHILTLREVTETGILGVDPNNSEWPLWYSGQRRMGGRPGSGKVVQSITEIAPVAEPVYDGETARLLLPVGPVF